MDERFQTFQRLKKSKRIIEKKGFPLFKKPVQPAAQPAAQGDDSLSGQFDSIINSLDIMTGIQVATALDKLRNDIIESRGYSAVLGNFGTCGNFLIE